MSMQQEPKALQSEPSNTLLSLHLMHTNTRCLQIMGEKAALQH